MADVRPEAQAAVKAAITEKIRSQPLSHWQAVFAQTDVCVDPVLTRNEAVTNEHLVERGMITSVIDKEGNVIKQINSALRFRKEAHQADAGLGEDTNAVLAELGYDTKAIDVLRETKCVK